MTAVIKCNTCNIVIDEMLSYIQNKVSVMDEETLVRIYLYQSQNDTSTQRSSTNNATGSQPDSAHAQAPVPIMSHPIASKDARDNIPVERTNVLHVNKSNVGVHDDVPDNIKSDNKNVLWGDRNEEQVAKYSEECHKRLRLIDFPSEFINCAKTYCNEQGHKHVLDGLYADIVSALRDAASVSRGGISGNGIGLRVMGWSRHVADAHRAARVKFSEWILQGKPRSGALYSEMCESRRVFKSRLKWCQNHQDQIRMDALAERHSKGDFRSFWKAVKKENLKPGRPLGVDGVCDHGEIANIFRSHFTVKSPLDLVERVFDADELSGTVNRGVTAKDVLNVIRNMTKGKSPGHDGLSIEHLQHAGPHTCRVLAMFYSLCVNHSYLPADLMKTVVIPIVKNKTGDLADKNNYRPISLATVIAKVFDGVLNSQLEKYVILHDNQFGFRPKLSTESAILCLKHTVRYYTSRGTPVYGCFLDLSKAFDLVDYNLLWNKLENVGLPRELINIFKYWYAHQVNSVRWAGAVSDSWLQCGVRQGGLTSPTLFNIYMNALIVELSGHHVGCHIDDVCVNNLSYADDMVLLSASVCGLRQLLRVCERYAVEHGLKYNVTKSQFMVFGTGGAKFPRNVPPVYLNGVPLDRVDHFKYLGHMVTAGLGDSDDIERERRALSRRANMLARRFARSSVAGAGGADPLLQRLWYVCGGTNRLLSRDHAQKMHITGAQSAGQPQ
ncbi:uncharacterized protein LOC113227094 [Hyposmocoma kahamanoa]|uniref:uncharacterized protein LOC113227094 n=1 Tax=Hyposmocoma kahamanoa TaxID=1477025 RepID=UPI000E6D7D37|nr:uncharacterized protein LOC113227094 [Hyposmocoma kahamanoa]